MKKDANWQSSKKTKKKGKALRWGSAAVGLCLIAGGFALPTSCKGISINKLEESTAVVADTKADEESGTTESIAASEESVVKTSEESTESTQSAKAEDISKEQINKIDPKAQTVPAVTREKLISVRYADEKKDYKPCVPAYEVKADLSNVINAERFYLGDEEKALLAKNGFFVYESNYFEFFDLYEMNRYLVEPSFITTDSIMHTYHLYFSMILKNTEKNSLCDEIGRLTTRMLDISMAQYNELIGTEWEKAARTNVIFFGVADKLMGGNGVLVGDLTEEIQSEVDKIMAAQSLDVSVITGTDEDYSQYKPRGYYDGDEQLEKYFRTMMWYGRMNFGQSKEYLNRSALLMMLALSDQECYDSWYKVYEVTSFFAGQSDDLGYDDYMPVIEQAYGKNLSIEQLIQNKDAFNTYVTEIQKLRAPEINSIVLEDGLSKEEKEGLTKGFRLMGQRFNLDAAIFTQLCYSNVEPTANGEKRMLPDALDVPAALGSEMALNLLKEQGNDKFPNYMEQMDLMRQKIAGMKDYWSSSLYGGWLFTLNPLLEKKGEGYPSFMTNTEWQKKNLETYLGSWTELKHDTILYAKQFIAEMGGGDVEADDRGYVEPEPELYARLSTLSDATLKGLDELGYLRSQDKEGLGRLSELAGKLREISIKELQNQTLTDEEYELIRSYGGTLEHFWNDTMADTFEAAQKEQVSDWINPEEYPMSLVADVATGDGVCLEEAIGGGSVIYVVFPIDGELRIGKGCSFTYYQFVHPSSDRLTDSQWRVMKGLEMDENYEMNDTSGVEQPDWVNGFTYRYAYE